MNISLKGKNALVCGSSKGIGRATAVLLASMGANVTISARSQDKLEQLKNELDTSMGQSHDIMVADFANQEALRALITSRTKEINFHILINNTGGPKGGPMVEAQTDAFIDAYQKHLVCNHIIATAVIPGMKADNYGRIVNIISTSVKSPIPGLGVSNTTRGAVASWAKTLAGEIGKHGITVNNVLPGFTATGRLDEIINNRAQKGNTSPENIAQGMKATVPMQRFAAPEEVANAIGFLVSPAAAYITGVSIPVDGGRTKCL